jgi:hypothetical protein
MKTQKKTLNIKTQIKAGEPIASGLPTGQRFHKP